MKLKLACADFTFPLLGHDDVLTLIAALDVQGVDIGLFEQRSHLQPSDQFKSVGRSAQTLKRKLDARGLKAADIFLLASDPIEFALNNPQRSRRRKMRDWFERTLEYAAICEARHVTISPGVFFNGHARADSLALAQDELAWRIGQARPYKIIMGVEPHIGSIIPRPATSLRLVEAVPGLTFTLDYAHFAYRAIPAKRAEPLIAHASHFHVRGARKGHIQTSFTDNVIDFSRILRVMQKTGYRGYLGLEYVQMNIWGCDQVDNLSETILYRDYLRSVMK